jgi:hypothetical protein
VALSVDFFRTKLRARKKASRAGIKQASRRVDRSMIRFIIAYALATGASYAAGHYLPESLLSPYIPVVAGYHLLLLCILADEALTGEQNLGLSMSLPMVIVSHLAFVGGMIGMVLGREHVPLFGLLQYVVPGLAPFEVKWVFEGKRKAHVPVEPANMPEGTFDDYAEFTEYLRGKRKFQRAGRTVNEEFAVWRADQEKRRARAVAAPAETTSA